MMARTHTSPLSPAFLTAPTGFLWFRDLVFLKRTIVLLCPHHEDGAVLIKQSLCEQFFGLCEEDPSLQLCASLYLLGWQSTCLGSWSIGRLCIIKELEESIQSRQLTMNRWHFQLCWGSEIPACTSEPYQWKHARIRFFWWWLHFYCELSDGSLMVSNASILALWFFCHLKCC